MKKIALIAIVASFAAPAAFAKGPGSNKDAAQEMVDNIAAAPKGIASELGGSPKASIGLEPRQRGWGNGGSDFFGTKVSRGNADGSL